MPARARRDTPLLPHRCTAPRADRQVPDRIEFPRRSRMLQGKRPVQRSRAVNTLTSNTHATRAETANHSLHILPARLPHTSNPSVFLVFNNTLSGKDIRLLVCSSALICTKLPPPSPLLPLTTCSRSWWSWIAVVGSRTVKLKQGVDSCRKRTLQDSDFNTLCRHVKTASADIWYYSRWKRCQLVMADGLTWGWRQW